MNILKSYRYTLQDLDCANCAKKIEDTIAKQEGYQDVNVNFSTLKLTFKTDKQNPKKEITQIIQKVEPEVNVFEEGEQKQEKEEHNGSDMIRIIVGAALYLITLIGKYAQVLSLP